jgi:hypothetical protein
MASRRAVPGQQTLRVTMSFSGLPVRVRMAVSTITGIEDIELGPASV